LSESKGNTRFHIDAVLLIDDYFNHLRIDTIELFSDNKVKIIIFPFHISGTFQIFDFVFFAMFKQAKRQRSKEAKQQRGKRQRNFYERVPDCGLHFIRDHARRMFRVSEMTGTSSIVCHSFHHC
jgi:hypothetical protein